MEYQRSEHYYICRLHAGEELHETVTQFAVDQEMTGAFITGLGAVRSATIGMYHMDQYEYQFRSLTQPHEITNLVGNIALNVDHSVAVHLHATLADESQNAFGGHLKDAIIEPTCEIIISPCGSLYRTHDTHSQLPLLDLSTTL